jgi:hypothetical protein
MFATGEKSCACNDTSFLSDNSLKITALEPGSCPISAALGEMLQTGFNLPPFPFVLCAEKKIYPVPSGTSRYEAVRHQGLPRRF